MAVYVDEESNTFGRMRMSHLCADTESELHEMADTIGLRRKWFQPSGTMPHYDVSQSKRRLAIEHGAIEIDARKMVELIRRYRNGQSESDRPKPARADLSPEAQRAKLEGQARARSFRPTIARTRKWVVIWRPSAHSGNAAAGFSAWMKANLPGFSFNAKRDWWEAPLEKMGEAMQAMGTRLAGFNLTRGAEEYANGESKQ